ncbi:MULTISPECIES: rhodanese-like domain-containing protein [Arthrobacter]|uniref:rhodanese-like domain-containing protein n=1 Tax=unclassified Arthrobacter TaxID=235627 RepID=UPI0024BAFD55|nr:rhodanese-like domain-containing protein [Arthrobacter sp. H35-MC1]MDJ0316691.1 rhodanese-like domain-containing protein [Arthrobacter sp. H35-MC1]
MSEIMNVTVAELGGDAVILDVREDYEWVAGHVDGAIHIPLEQLPERLEELDPDTDLNIICRTGGRSFRATTWLNQNGYSAFNVVGGMGAWFEAQKPMISTNGEPPRVL